MFARCYGGHIRLGSERVDDSPRSRPRRRPCKQRRPIRPGRRRTDIPMRSKNRSVAMLTGGLAALATPAAIAVADEPVADAPAGGGGRLHAALHDEPTMRSEMRDHLHDRLVRAHKRLTRRAGERHRDAHLWSN